MRGLGDEDGSQDHPGWFGRLPTGHRVPGNASSRSPRGSDANRCSALRRCAREKPTICELDLVDPVLVLAEISCRRTVATPFRHPLPLRGRSRAARSEEHTSELQSLMRISYAVFCLKQKNNNIRLQNTIYQYQE